jgi:plasmid stabilization system protein ParE
VKAVFLAGAKQDLIAAARWYEDRRDGLGDELLDEVKAALERLEQFPGIGSETLSGYRRCFVRRFPYALIYRSSGEAIVIVAVSHHRRRPGHWRRRASHEDKTD